MICTYFRKAAQGFRLSVAYVPSALFNLSPAAETVPVYLAPPAVNATAFPITLTVIAAARRHDKNPHSVQVA
jgi:hypothetical protein